MTEKARLSPTLAVAELSVGAPPFGGKQVVAAGSPRSGHLHTGRFSVDRLQVDAAIAPAVASALLGFLKPMVVSGSWSSKRLTSSTPCISEWSVFETSYFHIPNRPRL